ncbi:membrane protein [Agrobacterium sp. SUL3]|nr:membrane protein [Agrobacterium sp. SUL3]
MFDVHKRATPIIMSLSFFPTNASAHVKWFAPYIVGAPPQPIGRTLSDFWFWIGIGLVVVFFLLTRLLERSRWGGGAIGALNRLTAPVWLRQDDYIRAITAAFFIAIFSVGNVYLTPDLKTPHEWVSWLQLVIACCIFWRATMPLAGVSIIALWVFALRDYELFHLFDYLALGLGVAAYLVLEPLKNEKLRARRFEALRWGLAVALMWSSLEKFAFPDWFYPLVLEKPFLTFGMPRDVFIPMAGVAEFTLGFGLLWTPLIRRLSAIALLVIFTAAVWPFGRIDLIGHGLIMAILIAVAAEQRSGLDLMTKYKRKLVNVPVGLLCALTLFSSAYWGLHMAFFGIDGITPASIEDKTTHSYSTEHPHGPGRPAEEVPHSH